MPFVDSAELAGILGEPHATVHRALTGLLADGTVGRVSHGTAHLPSSQRYHLTDQGIREAAGILGFEMITSTSTIVAVPRFTRCQSVHNGRRRQTGSRTA